MIFNKIHRFNKNISLIDENSQLSYEELIRSSDKISKYFTQKSLVFFKGENDIESIFAYIGLIKANCALVMIDANINESSLLNLYNKYQPDYFFCKKILSKISFISNNFKLIAKTF